MSKTTARAAAAAAAAFGQEPCPCGAAVFFVDLNYSRQLIIRYPTPREVNSVAFVAGKLKEDEEPWLTIGHPISISIMNRADLEKPIELLGPHTWEQYMGQPMVQNVDDTCALVACAKCVEAVHRLQHEKLHGKGTTFPYRAAPPDDLLEACRIDGVWKPRVGAYVRDVLIEIQEMGGVLAITDAPITRAQRLFLALRSWEEHRWDDSAAGGLSPTRVAELLYNNGPCIGVLWVSPWYHRYDAGRDDALVYTSGCGRSDNDARRKMEELHPGETAWHAVVCFGYRFQGDKMHVLMLDNHNAITGPRRWIDVEDLHTLYTLSV